MVYSSRRPLVWALAPHRIVTRRTRKVALQALAAALFAGAAHNAFAYTYLNTFGIPLHWIDQNPATPATVDIFYDFRNIGAFTNSVTPTQKAIFQQALSDWSAVTNGKLVFTLSTTNNIGSILNLSVGDLAAVTADPNKQSAPGGVLGVTNSAFGGDGAITFSSVQLDFQENFDNILFNGNLGNPNTNPDFYSVALHEIGHALGLDHVTTPIADIMNPAFYGEKMGPAADDILGVSNNYSATPNYLAIVRNLPSFNVAYPPGNFNYFEGSPSIVSYWVDSGITNISGNTEVQDEGSIHQDGGIWTTNSFILGANGTGGSLFLTAGTLTATTTSVTIGALNQSGGLLQTHSLSFSPGTTFNWTGGTLSLTPGITQPSLSGITDLTVPSGGLFKTAGGHLLNSLTINGSVQLLHNGTARTVSKVNALTIAGSPDAWTGRLDLTNNALILQTAGGSDKSTAITTLQNQIASGLNGGMFNGPGITSSTLQSAQDTSLALADNADLHLTTFRGLSLDDNALLITIAHNGDATLDDRVDSFDLNVLATHWQQESGTLWSAGDFTGDGKVDAFDLNVLAANWQFAGGGALEAALAAFPQFSTFAAVPEPASLTVLALGAATLLSRRRTR